MNDIKKNNSYKEKNNIFLSMKGICKEYPGVKALDSVDFQLRKGEVHVLLGENGAGKSTLVKILSGAIVADKGEIQINGSEVRINNPNDSTRLGIRIVYQELNTIPRLSIGENIFLEDLPRRRFTKFVNFDYIYKKSSEILSDFNLEVNPRVWANDVSMSYRQMVEIAKALIFDARIIIFDEPTSSLSGEEIKELFSMIEKVKARGVSVIYISHRLSEVLEIGDRCTILRNGKKIKTLDLKNQKEENLIELMLGKKLNEKFGNSIVSKKIGKETLRVENINSRGLFSDVSFNLKQGEILGITGILGSGKTEIAKALFGVDPLDSGKIIIEGKEEKISSPIDAINKGICLLPEDRKNEGLCQRLSVKDNITLPSMKKFSIFGFLRTRKEREETRVLIDRLVIKTPSMNQLVQYLSGGNQQKTVLAKWLMMNADIYIFDEPTRGIDVGAKTEVYNLIRNLSKQKKSVIFISTEIPEIIAVSDRIIVMHNGKVNARFDSKEATMDKILYHSTVSGKENTIG